MQRVANYGSMLQAYALKQLLLQNNATDVRFIDIEPGIRVVEHKRPNKLSVLTNSILHFKLFDLIKKSIATRAHLRRFKRFYHLLDEDSNTIPEECQMVIIGSDEVFNCLQDSEWGFSEQLFGKMDCPYIISYAASFGHTTLSQIETYKIDSVIARDLKNLKDISVRDLNSYHIISNLINVNPLIHLDPVLAYGFSTEINSSLLLNEQYILIYTYADRIVDEREVSTIVNFAQGKKLKLYSLFCKYDWCDKELVPNDLFGIFSFFKSATYVFTDTFHGTIFSIITHRQFMSILRISNEQKLSSLVHLLGLDSRIFNVEDNDIEKVEYPINYEIVEQKLKYYRTESNEYLKKHIIASSR